MRLSQMLARRERPGWLERRAGAVFGGLGRAYRRRAARRAALALAGAARGRAGLFVASLRLAAALRREFVPPQDQNFIRIALQTPVGSSLAFTDARVREVETYLQARPEVLRYFAVGGIGGVPNQAFAGVTLVDKNQRAKSQAELMAEFRRDLAQASGPALHLPGPLHARPDGAPQPAGGVQPARRRLRGAQPDGPRDHGAAGARPGWWWTSTPTTAPACPSCRIIPDRQAAAARGVSMDDIGRTINAAIGGVREGKFTQDGRRYDVRLRLNPEERLSEEDVKTLTVRTSYGELIPLADVVRLETVKTLQTISRVNRQRAISVTANLAPGASQATALEAAERIAREVLPPGLHVQPRGRRARPSGIVRQTLVRVRAGHRRGLHGAGLAVQQLRAPLHGAARAAVQHHGRAGGALWHANQSLNLYSAIGLILLMGIVKKNSILLVEFTNQKRAEGMPLREAMLTAAPIRLRPILMTSVATMAAALPLALGIGAGSETRQPMALAIIGGVVVSTLFTLVVVPCAYFLMARLERRKHHPAV